MKGLTLNSKMMKTTLFAVLLSASGVTSANNSTVRVINSVQSLNAVPEINVSTVIDKKINEKTNQISAIIATQLTRAIEQKTQAK